MTGLIWFVQVVHYPLFAKVENESYQSYQELHQRLTTLVVGPPMLIEAFSSVLLLWYLPAGVSTTVLLTGVGLVFLIWISTAALSVPCHGRLLKGFDSSAHKRLVATNWPRTIGWTVRSGLMTYATWQWAVSQHG